MGNAAAGLGAMAFWFFLAAVVVGGIWGDARKRESQQETLRRLVESGQKLDKDMLDQLLAAGGSKDLARDLKVGGLIVIFVSPGLAILGWFLARIDENILPVMIGVSGLVGFVGIGLLVSAKYIAGWDKDHQA